MAMQTDAWTPPLHFDKVDKPIVFITLGNH